MMKRLVAPGIVALGLIAAGCGGSSSFEGFPGSGAPLPGWSKFMGNPGNTGLTPAPDITGVVKWKFRVSGVPGPAAIGPDGTVYFGDTLNGGLYAVNGATGTLKWSIPTFATFPGAPAIGSNGLLYCYLTTGVIAINAQDGQIVWSQAEVGASTDGIGMGPDGTLYIGTGDPAIVALDPTTGAQLWQVNTGASGPVISCPAVDANGVVYAAHTDGTLVAVNRNGIVWSVSAAGTVPGSMSLGRNGLLYVRAGFNQLRAYRTSDGTLAWSVTSNSNNKGQVIGPDGTVYATPLGAEVFALNPTTGAVLRTGAVTGNVGLHAMTDTTLYAETAAGLTALDAATLRQKWNIPTGGFITGAAAVGPDGTVVFPASDFFVYAVR